MGWRATELGPVALGDGVLSMRSPRLRDARAWSTARLANREWLEPAFPAWGDDWAAEQSPAAWVQRWLRLRVAAARGLAKPFVLVLDGQLVGELGIDAVDDVSGGGEASVWMVRSHGSADVMGSASLLLIRHAFADDRPIDRLVSPVATSSRKGRTPGLTAAGLQIEATIPRWVGAKGLVDHDIWVVQNTDATRTRVAKLLKHYPPATAPAEPRVPVPLTALARAAVRASRETVHALRAPAATIAPPEVPAPGVSLRRERAGALARVTSARSAAADSLAQWQILREDRIVGSIRIGVDRGTASAEILAVADRDREALNAALLATVAAVGAGTFGDVHAAVRVPLDPRGKLVADDALLTAAGLELAATFAGNPEGSRRWGGEQRWELPRTD